MNYYVESFLGDAPAVTFTSTAGLTLITCAAAAFSHVTKPPLALAGMLVGNVAYMQFADPEIPLLRVILESIDSAAPSPTWVHTGYVDSLRFSFFLSSGSKGHSF